MTLDFESRCIDVINHAFSSPLIYDPQQLVKSLARLWIMCFQRRFPGMDVKTMVYLLPKNLPSLYHTTRLLFQSCHDLRVGCFDGQKRMCGVIHAMSCKRPLVQVLERGDYLSESLFHKDYQKIARSSFKPGGSSNSDDRSNQIWDTIRVNLGVDMPMTFYFVFLVGENQERRLPHVCDDTLEFFKYLSTDTESAVSQSQKRTWRDFFETIVENDELDYIGVPEELNTKIAKTVQRISKWQENFRYAIWDFIEEERKKESTLVRSIVIKKDKSAKEFNVNLETDKVLSPSKAKDAPTGTTKKITPEDLRGTMDGNKILPFAEWPLYSRMQWNNVGKLATDGHVNWRSIHDRHLLPISFHSVAAYISQVGYLPVNLDLILLFLRSNGREYKGWRPHSTIKRIRESTNAKFIVNPIIPHHEIIDSADSIFLYFTNVMCLPIVQLQNLIIQQIAPSKGPELRNKKDFSARQLSVMLREYLILIIRIGTMPSPNEFINKYREISKVVRKLCFRNTQFQRATSVEGTKTASNLPCIMPSSSLSFP